MKILVISNRYFPNNAGGAEFVAQNIAESLYKKGHSVSVLTTAEENYMDKINGLTVYRIVIENVYQLGQKKNRFLRLFWHLRDIYNSKTKKHIRDVMEKEKPQIALCHNLAGFSISVWDELKRFNIPIVQVLHDQYLLCPKTIMLKKGKICKKQCFICRLMRLIHVKKSMQVSAVIGVSEFMINKIKEYGYFRNVPSFIIYNAVKIPRLECKVWDGTGELKIGFIGSLGLYKGIEWLIKEFIKLKINASLTIAGKCSSEYEIYLKNLSKGDSRIVFNGPMKNTEHFSKIHLSIVPSLCNESFGLVVVESLACNVPVIASMVGGIPEIIKENINGLFCFPENPNSLSECIMKFYNNPELLAQMSVNARESVSEFLNVDEWIEKYEKILELVIGGKDAKTY